MSYRVWYQMLDSGNVSDLTQQVGVHINDVFHISLAVISYTSRCYQVYWNLVLLLKLSHAHSKQLLGRVTDSV